MKLSRATDWKSAAGGPVLGVGARMFLVDSETIVVLECRQLEIHHE
jgi:protein involved in temperature-dependent protein secretion